MEATGHVFCNEQGLAQDCLAILQAQGINSVRLRVFVNPSDDKVSGHCSLAEVVVMAKRATDQDFRVMIDFHCSDTWADPGRQAKPAAGAAHPFAPLLTDVYDHTLSTLAALRATRVVPRWVEVGKEYPAACAGPKAAPKTPLSSPSSPRKAARR